jgi:hypothetical protein
MRHQLLVIGFAAALALGAGCSQQVQVYKSIPSLTEAARQADLVAEGRVTASDDVENQPVGEVWSNIFGKLGQECVVKTRVTFDISRVVKGPAADLKDPLAFWYHAPCFHAEPDVLLGISLPPVLAKGDRLRVYLSRSADGQYWLIAHEPLTARP